MTLCGCGLARLLTLLGMVNASWVGSIQSETFFQTKFIIFQECPSNRLTFYLGSPLHRISSLVSHFCLFQNAILHKMIKLGFWNFKPIFLRMQFLLIATFFSLVLVISLSWYFHPTVSYLTLITWHFERQNGLSKHLKGHQVTGFDLIQVQS